LAANENMEFLKVSFYKVADDPQRAYTKVENQKIFSHLVLEIS